MKQFTRAALSAFMIVLGVALSAFAMSVFVLPFDILAPGVTGLGRTLGIYFGADVSLVVWISNIALLLLGLVVLGWRFAASIVLGSVCFPLFLDLFDAMPWLSAVLSDPLYAAICAGVLEGVGLGLVIRAGGSSGGSAAAKAAGLVFHAGRRTIAPPGSRRGPNGPEAGFPAFSGC